MTEVVQRDAGSVVVAGSRADVARVVGEYDRAGLAVSWTVPVARPDRPDVWMVEVKLRDRPQPAPTPAGPRRPAGLVVPGWVWALAAVLVVAVLAGVGWAVWLLVSAVAANAGLVAVSAVLGLLLLAGVGGGCTIIITHKH